MTVLPAVRHDFGIDDRPHLLAEEVGQVDDEALGAVELRDRDEDGGGVEGFAGDAGEVQLVQRVDHRGRRVGRAEILQSALLVARRLRQGEIAVGRRNEGVDQQAGHRAGAADAGQGGEFGHRANQIDQVVVRDELELLRDDVALRILVGERPGIGRIRYRPGRDRRRS